MKIARGFRRIRDVPAGEQLRADDVREGHVARLLLLLRFAGEDGRVRGLKKLAKLDFFVRYPELFAKTFKSAENRRLLLPEGDGGMVRHHYGPWDHRYYMLLALLEGSRLIETARRGTNTYQFSLTDKGREYADALAARDEFASITSLIRRVGTVCRKMNGTTLAEKIYATLREEVTARTLGSPIES